MILSQLLTPEQFAKMSQSGEIKLASVIEAEIMASDDIRKKLKAKLSQVADKILSEVTEGELVYHVEFKSGKTS